MVIVVLPIHEKRMVTETAVDSVLVNTNHKKVHRSKFDLFIAFYTGLSFNWFSDVEFFPQKSAEICNGAFCKPK